MLGFEGKEITEDAIRNACKKKDLSIYNIGHKYWKDTIRM